MLRRIQAAVVVLALLIAPLALYARGTADTMRDCNGMCCLPHARAMAMQIAPPSAEPPQPAKSAASAESECHHGAAAKTAPQLPIEAPAEHSPIAAHSVAAAGNAATQCALECAAHRAPHSGNFGLLVPIAPTKPSHIAAIRTNFVSERFAPGTSQITASGFLGSPFQPPRA